MVTADPSKLAAQARRDYECIALVLQGGGALGAYQGGVVEALHEEGLAIDWVAGISIGALNAAIIAGNPPGRRVERLHEFWDTICQPPAWLPWPASSLWTGGKNLPVAMQTSLSEMAAWLTLTMGQPGFFRPRVPPPFLHLDGSATDASWYDTKPLRDTLERLADFDRINDARQMRVSVGAVNVRSGNFVYFDNTRERLRPEHFMASGALPPGFPAVEIDGEFYWDGGVVSNTPLYKVLREHSLRDTLVFQVDLWSAHGEVPHDMPGVTDRSKEIQYSSRTRMITNYMHEQFGRQRLLNDLMELVPPEHRDDPAYQRARQEACTTLVNLIHLIYCNKPYEGHYKDYEFSIASMHNHWQTGLNDMRGTLAHPEWLTLPTARDPFVTHDVHRRMQSTSA